MICERRDEIGTGKYARIPPLSLRFLTQIELV